MQGVVAVKLCLDFFVSPLLLETDEVTNFPKHRVMASLNAALGKEE